MTRAERKARALKMREMYEAGASATEVAAAFGLSSTGVLYAIRRVGGVLRPQAEAVRAKWQDPDFRKRNAEAMRAANRRHLDAMTPEELADYQAFKRAGATKAEALAGIHRPDLGDM